MRVHWFPRALVHTLLALILALLCFVSASAQTVISMDLLTPQKGSYSLEELAVQRFQVYGLLDDTAQDDDPLTVGIAAALINKFFDGAAFAPEEPDRKAAEADIAEMLLELLGYSSYGENSVGLAKSVGLRPIGMANEFSLGDMMLYLERCLELRNAEGIPLRNCAVIPEELEQRAVPNTVVIYPVDLEDAEKQIRRAFEYMPYYISIHMGEGLTVGDLDVLESRYEGYLSSVLNDAAGEEVWWLPFVHWCKNNFHLGVSRSSRSDLMLHFDYSDAARLIADLDDAFTPFVDDTITYLADAFYQENIAQYEGQYEEVIIREIESLISRNASYDRDAYTKRIERDSAYHISGFFENGKVVCLGYAELFSYLCQRADIQAITVLGSSKASELATREKSDHIWNKVKVGDSWYNEDICWGDDNRGCLERFSLKSDESIRIFSHYPAEHTAGVYAATANYTPTGKTRGFDDVPADAYYYDAVRWAVEQRVSAGTSGTTFSPDAACTRAQVITFLWRVAGSPEPEHSGSPFSDISDDAYYRDAVCWAVERGIANGTSVDTFSPNAICTRAQVVTFLWREQGPPEMTDSGGSIPFEDVPVDSYFHNAAAWAVEQGIAMGTGKSTFSPNTICTRAQVVTFLCRNAD